MGLASEHRQLDPHDRFISRFRKMHVSAGLIKSSAFFASPALN